MRPVSSRAEPTLHPQAALGLTSPQADE